MIGILNIAFVGIKFTNTVTWMTVKRFVSELVVYILLLWSHMKNWIRWKFVYGGSVNVFKTALHPITLHYYLNVKQVHNAVLLNGRRLIYRNIIHILYKANSNNYR